MKVEDMKLALKGGGLANYNNKAGKYIRLNASDYSGDVTIIMWDDKNPEKVWSLIQNAEVVEVDGKVEQYNGNIQIIATDIFPCKNYDPKLFIKRSDKDLDMMYDYLIKNAKTISNKGYKQLVTHFLLENKTKIYEGVGAKSIHHAEVGGWLSHTYEVLTIVNSTCKLFDVDKNLLRTATILHDIGKLNCYDVGVTVERNSNDYLYGHINMGIKMIYEAIQNNKTINISSDDMAKLIHVIANHHDLDAEFDRVSYTMESIIIRKADNISALADRFQNVKNENESRVAYYDSITKMQMYFGDR